MATGFAFLGKCYATQSEAADAYFILASPVLDTAQSSASSSYQIIYGKSAGVWKQQTVRSTSSTQYFTAPVDAVAPTFGACAMPETDQVAAFVDGTVLGWGVVACCAAVLFFKWAKEHIEK